MPLCRYIKDNEEFRNNAYVRELYQIHFNKQLNAKGEMGLMELDRSFEKEEIVFNSERQKVVHLEKHRKLYCCMLFTAIWSVSVPRPSKITSRPSTSTVEVIIKTTRADRVSTTYRRKTHSIHSSIQSASSKCSGC